jgi:heme A synthase
MTLLRRLAWVSLVLGFGHVVFGAIVRITGSGMGCGDHWPKCHGYWFPPLTRPDLIVEVSHRYFAATLTASVVALLVMAWRGRDQARVGRRGGVLRPAGLAAALVLTAALFGAFTVWLELENKLVIVTHLALAMALLATLVAVVVRAGGPPRLPIYAGTSNPASSFHRTTNPSNATDNDWHASPPSARDTAVAAALVFAAIVMGGLTAHIPGANVVCGGFPLCAGGILPTHSSQYVQFIHRIIAFAAFFQVGWLGVALTRRGERRLAKGARLVLTLIFAQLIVAATMIAYQLPPLWRSLHEAVGTLLWIVTFGLAYTARRLTYAMPATEPAVSPVTRAAEAAV